MVGGTLNAIAGGGSFLTFAAMVFVGIPSIVANAASAVALFPGALASACTYRRDLPQIEGIPTGNLIALSFAGSAIGAGLLLFTPQRQFDAIVPWLLLAATLLFAFGPTVTPYLRRVVRLGPATLMAVQFVIAIYGGYFGGAMGILMLASFSLFGMTNFHRMNALKTLLAGLLNGLAVAIFVIAGKIAWGPGMLMMAAGTSRRLDRCLGRKEGQSASVALRCYRHRGRDYRGIFPKILAPPRRGLTTERDGRLRRQQPEGEAFLDIEPHCLSIVVEIADGEILADGEFEIAAAHRQHHCTVKPGGPDQRSVDDVAHVFKHWIAATRGLGQAGISMLGERHRVRAADAAIAQLGLGTGDDIRKLREIVAERDRVSLLRLRNAMNAGCGITVKDDAIFCDGDLPSRGDDRIGIRILGAAIDGVELASLHLKRNAKLDERQDMAQSRFDLGLVRRRHRPVAAGADCSEFPALGPDKIDDATRAQ